MGNSASIVATKLEAIDSNLLQICDDLVMKGSELFIENENARRAFIKYFNKGSWKDKLGHQHYLLDDTFDAIREVPMDSYSDFVFSSSPSDLAAQQLLTSDCGIMSHLEQSFILEDVQQKMKSILLAAVFPLFLESSDYSDFLEEEARKSDLIAILTTCLLYTSPSPRDRTRSRMPSSA